MIKHKVFSTVFLILFILIIVFIGLSIKYYYFNSIQQQKGRTLYFQNTIFKDNYNSTFSMDVKFTSEKFDFFVREKIHVTVSIQRIYNNSIFPLSSIFFVLVTTEGHFMPSQNSSGLKVLDSLYPDIYYLEYDAYLDFSTKYSCRLILFYYNTTNYTIIEDEQFVGPILEVQPVSVELQSRWNELQYDAMNETISFSLIVIVFTLVIILITWIDKFDSLYPHYQTAKKMIHKWIRKIRGKS